MSSAWIDEVLDFWFRELEPRNWFARDDEIDQRIRARFSALYERVRAAARVEPDAPEAFLATVIVLDQFSRNMFRGTPRAYESDARALAVSQSAIERGYDLKLERPQRVFLYMPWQHSEDRATQVRSVQLFEQLGDAEALKYARAHKDVIDRFGRFPHRNAVLGRASTQEEIDFMKTHPGF